MVWESFGVTKEHALRNSEQLKYRKYTVCIYINHKVWEQVLEYDKLVQLVTVSVVGEIIAESDMERWSRIAQPSFVIYSLMSSADHAGNIGGSITASFKLDASSTTLVQVQ